MTERLYYNDAYLRDFDARVIRHTDDGLGIYLERSAFYPTSGGQPFDVGTISGVPVTEVIDEGEEILHRIARPLLGDNAHGQIDWARRFDHMQQHTGQHLLSAIFMERLGLKTVSFHLGQESSTIDLETASLDKAKAIEAERLANQAVFENRPVSIAYEEAGAVAGLRKASAREGTLRVVSIEGLDRSACGGTHVKATGEIAPIRMRKVG